MKLNLGCGTDIKPGYVNLDLVPLKGVDVVCNLDKPPLPFKDNQFEGIYCRHVLEHVDNFLPLIEELYRISKPEGIIRIEAPHCSSVLSYTDPTHRRFFTYNSMRYFEEDYIFNFYSRARFETVKVRLQFSGGKFQFLNHLVDPLVNLVPNLYERLWMWLLPVENIFYILKVKKSAYGQRYST